MATSAKPLFRATKAKAAPLPALPMELPKVKPPVPDARREKDFYPTAQPEALRALFARDGKRIRQCGTVWEPCCGDGAMVRIIRDEGLPCCASDIVDRGCPDSWVADFFTCRRSRAKAIITNPPYSEINARDGHGRWLRHTLEMPGWDYCALLLSWDWPAAVKNGLGELLDAYPFSYCYLLRWKLDFTGEGSPPQRNAWFIWDKHHTGPSEFRFMDRVDGRQGCLKL